MKLYIKNMVSNSCKMAVEAELSKLGLHAVSVNLGEIDVKGIMPPAEKQKLSKVLQRHGFELMDDKKAILMEKIKNTIIEMVHYSNKKMTLNFSDYLSRKLKLNYTYMANLFSESQGTTIEQFIISHKIERAKELLLYKELNISEIAQKLHYCSVAHLSNQFKKLTGVSPSGFRKQTIRKRSPIEDIGNMHHPAA
ncbi:AraC family transcriptional regulator [Flavobacterium suncheonense]|nr:AraC family transcriptional regulator [Flavobacterium suncheonense]